MHPHTFILEDEGLAHRVRVRSKNGEMVPLQEAVWREIESLQHVYPHFKLKKRNGGRERVREKERKTGESEGVGKKEERDVSKQEGKEAV